jgi:Zn-dependent membrane protease YugP
MVQKLQFCIEKKIEIMFGVYAIGILFFIISLAVSSRLKSKFKKYSQTPITSGLSGAEIAKKNAEGQRYF